MIKKKSDYKKSSHGQGIIEVEKYLLGLQV